MLNGNYTTERDPKNGQVICLNGQVFASFPDTPEGRLAYAAVKSMIAEHGGTLYNEETDQMDVGTFDQMLA